MKIRVVPAICASVVILFLNVPASLTSAANAGGTCAKAGAISGTIKKPIVCKKVLGKLKWVAIATTPNSTPAASVVPSTAAKTMETVSQTNARKSAYSYLSHMAFSRSGLIHQLEYEGYSNSDATYGVDAQNADWNLQAAKSAKSYLSHMSFSHSGLVHQLVYEGFTPEQAEYGVGTTGL